MYVSEGSSGSLSAKHLPEIQEENKNENIG